MSISKIAILDLIAGRIKHLQTEIDTETRTGQKVLKEARLSEAKLIFDKVKEKMEDETY